MAATTGNQTEQITAIMQVQAKQGHEEDALRELHREKAPSSQEGCLNYSVWEDMKKPGLYTAIGLWANQTVFNEHMQENKDAMSTASEVMEGAMNVALLRSVSRAEAGRS